MKLHQEEPPSIIERLAAQDVQDLMTSRWVADMIGVATDLEISEFIGAGTKTVKEIAKAKGLHAPSLYRLLRALSSHGIFAEQEDGTFAQTPMSDALRKNAPYSAWGMARLTTRPWSIHSWMELKHSVRAGTSAFENAYGMQIFEYFNKHPEELEMFTESMRSFSVTTGAALADTYDFSGIRTLADIGGSHGYILSLIMQKNPDLRAILFDLPTVVQGAPSFIKSCGLEDRIDVRSGDFFVSIPSGADAYMLKHILHDWSDEDCLRILRNIHAVAQPGTKLLIVDAVIGAPNEPEFAKILDIQMLVLLRGKERTRAEWNDLLRTAGFKLTGVVPTPSFTYVVEAVRGS
jgi:hypothetical protein